MGVVWTRSQVGGQSGLVHGEDVCLAECISVDWVDRRGRGFDIIPMVDPGIY